jgi:hypothetical protein
MGSVFKDIKGSVFKTLLRAVYLKTLLRAMYLKTLLRAVYLKTLRAVYLRHC